MAFKGILLDYQEKAVDLFKNKKRVLFGHPVGTGKTIMAIASADSVGAKRILVLLEKSNVIHWKEEIEKYSEGDVVIVQSDEDFKKKGRWVLLVYEQLYTRDFYIKQFDMVILDEITKVKNWNKLYKKVSYITRFKEYVLGLTATPVENKLEEFFNIFRVVNPDVFKGYNLNRFREEFIKGRWEKVWNKYLRKEVKVFKNYGYKNIDKFKEMISSFYITSEGNDINRKNIVKWLDFDLETYQRYIACYRRYEGQMGLDMVTDLELILSGVVMVRNDKEVIDRIYIKDNIKVQKLKEIVELMKTGIVVFSKYKEPLIMLKEIFGERFDYIYGDLSMDARNDIIDRFNNGDLPVLGLSPAGEKGINLYGGRVFVFLNQLFNPARNEQLAGRILRLNNKYDKVYIIKLLVNKSIDGWVEHLLDKKLDLFKEFIKIKDWERMVFYEKEV